MPSGAKRRKAAKKKKPAHENNGNHHSTNPFATHPHGDDELKHHDDKESDAEEASSPTSENHPNNHDQQFPDGDKEEVEKSDTDLHFQSSSEEKKSVEGLKQEIRATETTIEGECVAQIGKEFCSKNELSSEGVIVEEVEPKIESTDGILLQSQDEGISILGQSDVNPMDVVEPTKKSTDLGLSQHLEEGNVIQIKSDLNPINELETNRGGIVHVETMMESRNGGLLQNQDKEPRVAHNYNVVVDNAASVCSSEAVRSLSENLAQVPSKVSVGNNHKSVLESGDVDQMVKILSHNEKMNGIQSASVNGFMRSDMVPETTENGDELLDLQGSNGRIQPDSGDLGSENKGIEASIRTNGLIAASNAKVSAAPETEEKSMLSSIASRAVATDGEAIIKTDDIIALSEAKTCASEETGEKVLRSYNALGVVASNGAEYTKKEEHSRESRVPESSGNQKLQDVVLAQPIVERTSWLNCCGLIDLFGGSDK